MALELEKTSKRERRIMVKLWVGKKREQNYVRNKHRKKSGSAESRLNVRKM
jgi:hypothetical protein